MKRFCFNREFINRTAVLMLPVIVQQLITIGINFMDNLMVGSFGETQIAVASFGNQFYSLFQFICMGLGSGAIVNSSVQVLSVLNMGISGASAIVIGNSIGEGQPERARREGNSYVLLSAVVGLIIIPLLLLIEKPYIGLYSIEASTRAITHSMLIINCWMMPFQTMAFMTSKGILRGGGDTRFLLLADSSCVWFISLPLGALAGLVWHLSPAWVFFLLRVEYPLKGLVCLVRYFSGKWIKEILAE